MIIFIMNEIDHLKVLSKLDLNLIVVLRALEEHRHVTRTAEFLGISQSAVSHALSRLREAFHDDLYVKTPRGMVPTPKAELLAPRIAPLITALSDVFSQQSPFSPADLKRTFRIQTTDLIETLLLPNVLDMRASQAPNMKVSFRSVGFSLPKTELQDGSVDLAIAGFFGDLPDGFYRQRLLVDSFRCCIRKDHPTAAKKLTLAAYCALPHILIAPGGELTGQVDKALAKAGMGRQIAMGTSGFLAAGWAVAQSDAVLTAPSKLIEEFEKYLPIRSFAVPLELPTIGIVQVWHERQHKDAAHKWFRERLRDAFKGYT
jgi:DNA-binding transcriptional LysR family regulator